jgi:hypothetical protein
MDNDIDQDRDNLITSIVKNNITGDIEDINKDGFSSKAATIDPLIPSELRLQR